MTTASRYRPATQLLHWLLAGLIIFLMASGARLADLMAPQKASALQVHAGLGLMALALASVGVARRILGGAPAYPATMTGWEMRAARWAAWLLFGVALWQPATGLLHAATYVDFDVMAFGLWNLTALLPSRADVTGVFHDIHAAGFFLLYLLIAVHVAAALKHALVDDDDIPWRMLPRRLSPPLIRAALWLRRRLSA